MRRKRQQLNPEECIDILTRATSGVLSVSGDGGYPYGVPLSHVYHDGNIYFHSAVDGHKVDALRREPKCSFCVVDRDDVKPDEFTTYFRSVIVFGRIKIIDNPEQKLQALRMLGERFSPGRHSGLQRELDKSFDRVLVMCLIPEHITGKQAIELVPHQAR